MKETSKRAILAANVVGSTLDNPAKNLFAHKEIIAPVLQLTVPEFMDCSVDEIISLIDADSIKDDIPVGDLPPLMIDRGTEITGYTEKDIFFDKHFKVKNPKLSQGEFNVMLHVDFEVQNDYRPRKPDYQIVSRAMYYAARELSSQLGPLKENTDYGKLEKVYSIWVCNNNVPKELKNTVSIYSMKKGDLIGNAEEDTKDYDLISVIIIRRGSERKLVDNSVLDYLSAVFEGNLKKVDGYTAIKDKPEIRKEVENMSGIGAHLIHETQYNTWIEDLDKLVKANKISGFDEAKEFFPSLEDDDVTQILEAYNRCTGNN